MPTISISDALCSLGLRPVPGLGVVRDRFGAYPGSPAVSFFVGGAPRRLRRAFRPDHTMTTMPRPIPLLLTLACACAWAEQAVIALRTIAVANVVRLIAVLSGLLWNDSMNLVGLVRGCGLGRWTL